ncbi:DUF1759 domain-containing protein, partial [Wolbachia pipientis]|nr:DUF1759 domain-containing protein [Wolbachia pipientis]
MFNTELLPFTMSAEAFKALKAKRTAIKAQCTRTRNAINNIDPLSVDIAYLKQRKEKFDAYWNQFNELHMQIVELLELSSDLENVENLKIDQEVDCAAFEESYFITAAKIDAMIASSCASASVSNMQNSPLESNVSGQAPLVQGYVRDISQVHLPKIAIPKFSGNYEDWYPFYNTFESMIHLNMKLTNIQRFHYLISSLEGDAAHVIKSIQITSDNYCQALELLKQRFDDKSVISQEHIKSLFNLSVVPKKDHVSLRKLIDDVLRHLRSLKGLDRPTEHWDDLIIYLIITKLDSSIISDWKDHIPADEMPTLKHLTDFLTQKCKTMATLSNGPASGATTSNTRKTNKVSTAHVSTSNICCAYCKGKHHIFQCSDFLKLPGEDRIKQVRTRRLCLNCLRSTSHQAKDCKSSTCQTCGKKHNTLLHMQNKVQTETVFTNQPNQTSNSDTVVLTHRIASNKCQQVILSTAIINVYDRHGNTYPCRILLDSGSQSNFITEHLAKTLDLTRKRANLYVTGINKSQAHSEYTVNVRIKSFHTSFTQTIECHILNNITENLPPAHINVSNFKIPNNIRLADPQFHVPGSIDILIGAEIFWQLLCIGQIRVNKSLPILQKTQLGWIIGGKTYNDGPVRAEVCTLSINQQINQAVNKLWEMELINNEVSFNPDEENCMKLFAETTTRTTDGRFVVQMPIKEAKLHLLGESRDTALRRFLSLERKLQKQPTLKDQYVQFMNDYLALGHMERITIEQELARTPRNYIPHHAVLKSSSLTTKLRVVFDASCKNSTGISLNECLSIGPTLQEDLFSILLRFRTFQYVITADITQMYRQVLIDKSQTPLQTIFW